VFVANASPKPVTGFRDITLGTNAGCVAKPGYDYCSGIGAVLAAALARRVHTQPQVTSPQGSGGRHTTGSSGHHKTGARSGNHRKTRKPSRRHRRHHDRGFTG
jgi:hypothetical protein